LTLKTKCERAKLGVGNLIVSIICDRFFVKTFPRSQHPEFFFEVEKLVPKAKQITLIATGLNIIWEKHIVDLLLERTKSGEAKVTICLGSPCSPHVEDRLVEEEMEGNRPPVGKDGIERNLKALMQLIENAGNPENFAVRLFEHYPTFATLIFDQDIFIYPYAYIILGNESPIFHFKNNDSEEANFFLSNADRIIRDSVPAKDIVYSCLSRKHFSDDWISAAVYPDKKDPFYQFGSSVLGYDIRAQKVCEACNQEVAELQQYAGEASEYGFHLTLADALYFINEAEIDRIKAELRTLAESFPPFKFTNFRIVNDLISEKEIVILCDDPSGVTEALHFELLSRMYTVAISSNYSAGLTRKKIVSKNPQRAALMVKRYGSPYILKEFDLHFTLCDSCPTDINVRKDILSKLESAFKEYFTNEEVEIDELCLLVKNKNDDKWKIDTIFPLSGKV
jgi:hypothetical protein